MENGWSKSWIKGVQHMKLQHLVFDNPTLSFLIIISNFNIEQLLRKLLSMYVSLHLHIL